jgi:hypothetical protein
VGVTVPLGVLASSAAAAFPGHLKSQGDLWAKWGHSGAAGMEQQQHSTGQAATTALAVGVRGLVLVPVSLLLPGCLCSR